jgi:hypothetical protein
MTWYKLSGSAGPGHQGTWEEYVWLTGDWSQQSLRDLTEEYVPDWAQDGSNICNPAEKLDDLPDIIHAQKVMEYKSKLHLAKRMLNILGVRGPGALEEMIDIKEGLLHVIKGQIREVAGPLLEKQRELEQEIKQLRKQL